MAALNEIVAYYQELKKEWGKPAHNLSKCGELLNKLKVNN